jgi:hypothetical protein
MTDQHPPKEFRRATEEEIPDYEKRWRYNLKVEKAERKEEWNKTSHLYRFLGVATVFVLPMLLLWLVGIIAIKTGMNEGGIDGTDKCTDSRGSYDC